jgi:hypothetical protein
MNPSGTYGHGQVFYYADPGGQFFVAEWDSMAHYGSTIYDEYYTFELILYPNGDVDCQYKAIVPGTMTPFPSATVGIENGTGTMGVQVTFDGSGPLEPVSLSGLRIYSVSPPMMHDVTIDMLATGTTQFPYSVGGTLEFDVTLTNNEAAPVDANLWFMYGPREVGGPYAGTLPVGPVTAGFEQDVPPSRLPVGTGYSYHGKVGNHATNTVWDEDFITFDIIVGDGGSSPISDWECRVVSGWFDDPTTLQTGMVVEEFALNGVYPNPFNPTTTLSYALPEAAKVTLNVYDVSGRLVAEVVNGWRNAGVHDVLFDGSGLASGIYVFTLTAGDYNTTGKMVLMK